LRKVTMKLFQHGVGPVFLCGCLVLASIPNGLAYSTGASGSQQQPPQAAQQSPEQLQQLVAPIALYPDPLIAQILAAATYPTEVVEAQQWMQQNHGLTGDALAKEVDKQSWDPSVKGLMQFPAVLANLNQNLAWTSELGDAYVNQKQDVTEAIQLMRQRAKNAGSLKSTPQENVTTTDGDTIVIQPTASDEVYVPQYDPWVVYGSPLAVFPGWAPDTGLYPYGPGIAFGLGFVGVGLFAGYGWGWNHWGCDWHGGGAVFNHQSFVSHSTNIVNRASGRNDFHSAQMNHGNHFNGRTAGGRTAGGHGTSHAASSLHAAAARHSSGSGRSGHGGLSHGGIARTHSFFHSGGSHGGGFHRGGFHGGGFHGGHGGGHGGGHRR
jgi:Protein of unknown function (DUF3300)